MHLLGVVVIDTRTELRLLEDQLLTLYTIIMLKFHCPSVVFTAFYRVI